MKLKMKIDSNVFHQIGEFFADLQKIATGEVAYITLQRAVDEEGLDNDALDVVKTMLGVHGEGISKYSDLEDDEDDISYEMTIFETNIPDVQYVEYWQDGRYGDIYEVYLHRTPMDEAEQSA